MPIFHLDQDDLSGARSIKVLLIFYSAIFIVQVMSSAQASAWFGLAEG